jgi:hypothetical protein
LTSKQELNQAKDRLLKAIAANKVKLSQSNEYLKIQQGDREIAIAINRSSVANTTRSFR